METRLVKLSRILLSALFIFSAITKLLSLPFFDGLVAELLIGKDYYNHASALWYTQALTRILISAELVLGLAVLQESFLKKLVLPAIQIMLALFTIHLFYEGFTHENGFTDGNCGCFGDIIPMNNLESIIKNVVAMLLGLFVWKAHKDGNLLYEFNKTVPSIAVGIICLITLWLTIKDYSPKEPVVEEEIQEEIMLNLPAVNAELTKHEVDSLVKLYEFQTALDRALLDSSFTKSNPDYVDRLIEVIEIEKK